MTRNQNGDGSHINASLLAICKRKLLAAKADLLNRLHSHFIDLQEREAGGDEVDQSVSLLAEDRLLLAQRRVRGQLYEIELALTRIERGQYGICEETAEPIEADRLLAIPWTRYSIEGAELREAESARRA